MNEQLKKSSQTMATASADLLTILPYKEVFWSNQTNPAINASEIQNNASCPTDDNSLFKYHPFHCSSGDKKDIRQKNFLSAKEGTCSLHSSDHSFKKYQHK
ncbi:hypothetical protein QYF61_019225 [Mycteria americana]|uniref:Uncharacterized protein n=1 Tax=Mycteria americana TaxID=33587 RepID=A0AAN7NTM8_MYCAM|nr:hypothetical protein QYF61_019225 [Mycteria americana]